jgi:hypothetical protein
VVTGRRPTRALYPARPRWTTEHLPVPDCKIQRVQSASSNFSFHVVCRGTAGKQVCVSTGFRQRWYLTTELGEKPRRYDLEASILPRPAIRRRRGTSVPTRTRIRIRGNHPVHSRSVECTPVYARK